MAGPCGTPLAMSGRHEEDRDKTNPGAADPAHRSRHRTTPGPRQVGPRRPTPTAIAISERVDKLDDRVSEVQLGLATLAANTKARIRESRRAFRSCQPAFRRRRRAIRRRRQATQRRRPKHRHNPRPTRGSRELVHDEADRPDRRSGAARAGGRGGGRSRAAAACPWRPSPSLLSRCAAARSGGTASRASGSGCRQGTARRRCQARPRSRT